jgi:hypothetical protein
MQASPKSAKGGMILLDLMIRLGELHRRNDQFGFYVTACRGGHREKI